MKNLRMCLVIIVAFGFMLGLTSCGYKLIKKSDQPVQLIIENPKPLEKNQVMVTIGEGRTLNIILNELLANGQIVDRDIFARDFGGCEYTWEKWIIKDRGGDFHAIIYENGKLTDISPAADLEEAHSKFKPYTGWRK